MKWTRRLLLGLIVLAGLITALWWEENWRGQKIWEESCARLRAAGEPVEIADIIPPMIPDAENVAAAPIFAEIFTHASTARLCKPLLESSFKRKGIHEFVGLPLSRALIRGDDSLVIEWRNYVQESLPGSADIPAGLSPAGQTLFLLSPFSDVWKELGEGVRRPKCRWPLDYGYPRKDGSSHYSSLLRITPLARARLVAHASKGDSSSYVDDLVTTLLVAKHCHHPSMNLISDLVGTAIEGSALEQWRWTVGALSLDDAALAKLQRQAADTTLADPTAALRAERVRWATQLRSMSVDELADLVPGSLVPVLKSGTDWQCKLQAILIVSRPRGWKLAELSSFQDQYVSRLQGIVSPDGKSISASKFRDAQAVVDRMQEHPRNLSLDSVSAEVFGSSLIVLKKAVRRQAFANCAITWCAAERYRQKYGHPPDSLERLVPEFVDEVPVDPVNGAPLHYVKKGESDYLVYSLGWNEVDDGGKGAGRKELDWVWASDPTLLQEEAVADRSGSDAGSAKEQ